MSKYKWKKNLICFGGAIGIATSPLTIYHSIIFLIRELKGYQNNATFIPKLITGVSINMQFYNNFNLQA